MATDIRQSDATGTIVLIHGLWMTPLSWEHWVARYSALGYRVLAPSWPGMEGDVAQLRRDPSPFARLGVTEIADHYDRIIRKLPQSPIIMGHSFGGLITQILLDRGLGAAGVAIDPAQPKGVLALPFSTLRVGWPVLSNPANNHRTVMLTAKQFYYAFTNTLDERAASSVYERYAVPGPGRPLFQAALANFNPNAATRVNFRNDDRAPLLLLGGGQDHVVPTAITRSNYALYRKSQAVTEYKEYPDRSHYTAGERGWEAVADYALNWATQHVIAAAQPGRVLRPGANAGQVGADFRGVERTA